MSWFKKRKKEDEVKKLPELPGSKKLPELPKLHNFNEEKPILPPPSKEIELKKPEIVTPETHPSKEQNESLLMDNSNEEPIFVKIDKFKSASENFEKLKEKVDEIEKTVMEIREVKDKEEDEIKNWEDEIDLIKSRMDNIDGSLFKNIK